MTSLIDVIFLLLLFFMLSSTFSRFGDLPFLVATGGAAAAGQPPALLRISPDGLMLNLTQVALDDLAAALAALDADMVLVTVADAVTAQALVDVMVVAQAVPDLSLRLIGG